MSGLGRLDLGTLDFGDLQSGQGKDTTPAAAPTIPPPETKKLYKVAFTPEVVAGWRNECVVPEDGEFRPINIKTRWAIHTAMIELDSIIATTMAQNPKFADLKQLFDVVKIDIKKFIDAAKIVVRKNILSADQIGSLLDTFFSLLMEIMIRKLYYSGNISNFYSPELVNLVFTKINNIGAGDIDIMKILLEKRIGITAPIDDKMKKIIDDLIATALQ